MAVRLPPKLKQIFGPRAPKHAKLPLDNLAAHTSTKAAIILRQQYLEFQGMTKKIAVFAVGLFLLLGFIFPAAAQFADQATYASEYLFDRTGTSSTVTTLVRAANIGDGLGNTAGTGALIALSPVPGSGSPRYPAEYPRKPCSSRRAPGRAKAWATSSPP